MLIQIMCSAIMPGHVNEAQGQTDSAHSAPQSKRARFDSANMPKKVKNSPRIRSKATHKTVDNLSRSRVLRRYKSAFPSQDISSRDSPKGKSRTTQKPLRTTAQQAFPRPERIPRQHAPVTASVQTFMFRSHTEGQTSFQERLAAWQERENQAEYVGKRPLQPISLNARKDNVPYQAAKPVGGKAGRMDGRLTVQTKEFCFASDRRLKDRRDWEDRLRMKEQVHYARSAF